LDAITTLGELSAGYGVLANFVVMLLKEVSVPVPVPSDLIMVAAGVQVPAGAYSPLEEGQVLKVVVLSLTWTV
jgi:membrane protein DedA with SNARE-associated domain